MFFFSLANTFSQSLDHLTSTQNEIRDQLRTQKDSLDKVWILLFLTFEITKACLTSLNFVAEWGGKSIMERSISLTLTIYVSGTKNFVVRKLKHSSIVMYFIDVPGKKIYFIISHLRDRESNFSNHLYAL